MIVGVFHPSLDLCGGREHVAVNIINALKQHGYKVVVLVNKRIDRATVWDILRKDVLVDKEIVLPYPYDYPLLTYAHVVRSSIFKKLGCDILVDTCSNLVLPSVDISYIHFPTLAHVSLEHTWKYLYYLPYLSLIKRPKGHKERLVLTNSRFTAKAIAKTYHFNAHVIYPPVQCTFLHPTELDLRKMRSNLVVTVSRFSKEKRLEIVPHIAKLVDRNIRFLIVGTIYDRKAFRSLSDTIRKVGVGRKVKLLTNVTREHLRNILWTSKVYLHTMINEHFGISIVEAMASGCVPVVHNSGGPMEYVPKRLRYETIEEAAERIEGAVSEWSPTYADRVSVIASRFSENEFSRKFMDLLNVYVAKTCD